MTSKAVQEEVTKLKPAFFLPRWLVCKRKQHTHFSFDVSSPFAEESSLRPRLGKRVLGWKKAQNSPTRGIWPALGRFLRSAQKPYLAKWGLDFDPTQSRPTHVRNSPHIQTLGRRLPLPPAASPRISSCAAEDDAVATSPSSRQRRARAQRRCASSSSPSPTAPIPPSPPPHPLPTHVFLLGFVNHWRWRWRRRLLQLQPRFQVIIPLILPSCYVRSRGLSGDGGGGGRRAQLHPQVSFPHSSSCLLRLSVVLPF
jgi:hypothetical protein